MDLAIATTSSFSYAEVSTMTETTISKRNVSKLIVEPRLTITKEKLKRISDRSLSRYLAAAEKLSD
ncbi:hypothetical protein [Acinetobacter lwoffii]|jgi:hypothetical protein|uniref:hypothetical protein n=1 Tax=Acinetobacter lwoffii TaxID=28090 RepID=UPI003F91E9BA